MNEDENKSKVVFVDLEEYKQMGKVRKDPDPVPQKAQKTAPVSEEKKGPSASEKIPEKKSAAETKKAAEKPKTASVSPAKKASGTYAAESGRSTKKWFYNIAGVTLVFGLIVYFIWDYREKKAEEKENAFESVEMALDDENYNVIVSAEDLIEEYPDDSRGYEYLAAAYYGTGEYEKALEVLDEDF